MFSYWINTSVKRSATVIKCKWVKCLWFYSTAISVTLYWIENGSFSFLRNVIGGQLWCHRFPLIYIPGRFLSKKYIYFITPLVVEKIIVCQLRKFVWRLWLHYCDFSCETLAVSSPKCPSSYALQIYDSNRTHSLTSHGSQPVTAHSKNFIVGNGEEVGFHGNSLVLRPSTLQCLVACRKMKAVGLGNLTT